MVGCRRLPAAVASPAVMAVRRRRIRVRTRVRFARLTSARSRDCAARFKTDFFFFLTLVACPWAIYCSFCVSLKLLTLNEAHAFVKLTRRSPVGHLNKHIQKHASHLKFSKKITAQATAITIGMVVPGIRKFSGPEYACACK